MAKKLSLKPLGDRVIVEPSQSESKTKGGVVLPDSVEKEKPQEGKVVSVGLGKEVSGKIVKPQVKIGEKVLYKKYSGDEIEVNEQKLIILEADDILAIIK